jgi:hypothetical protein
MKAADDDLAEIDPSKRDDIYRGAFGHINEMRSVLPIASIPTVYAYSKDVQILENQRSETVRLVGDFTFK